ncbi:MAG TPA: glycosyltransferase family 4 protein [Methanomicrobiales archaeon]|nr:glycosyltransferase family 4 protein [Methanomicrobiales archaeon]
MRINFVVEDFSVFKYIGSATAARSIYRNMPKDADLELSWNSARRDVDLAHFHTFGPMALAYRAYAKGVKVLTAHSTPHSNQGNLGFEGVINRLYPPIYGGFDHIITVSDPCDREIKSMLPGMETTVIPNGVDRRVFQRYEDKRRAFRAALGVDEDETVVLTLGQQTPRKGIYDFLELAARTPEVIWVWVGGFPYGRLSKDYARIEREKRKASENVVFTGFVPDVTEAYSGADLFFFGSRAETFGLVILEALASGLPVAARGIPELREIFGDAVAFFDDLGQAGELVRPGAKLRLSGDRARQWTERFDVRIIAEAHAKLYRRLAEP